MLVLLVILVFLYHFGIGIYSAGGLEPSPTFEFLYTVAFLCCAIWWLKAEARLYGATRVYCLGLLVGVGWKIIIPHHLFKTRGIRGFIPLSALIGCFLVAHILGIFVFMILSN
jgi:hypothetical protein